MSGWLAAAIVAALIVALGALYFLRPEEQGKLQEWTNFSQAVFGMVSAIAIMVAGIFYFVERRDKARLDVDIEAKVHRLWPQDAETVPFGDAGPRELLLTVRVPIENKSYRKVLLRCLSVDILALPSGAALERRNPSQDLIFRRLAHHEYIAYDAALREADGSIRSPDEDILACLAAERKRHPGADVRPLFMWRRLHLEPGEADDVYFEKAVSCDYSAVRIIVKLRRAPDTQVHESKTVLPIVDTCRGLRETRSSGAQPAATQSVDEPALAIPVSGGDASVGSGTPE